MNYNKITKKKNGKNMRPDKTENLRENFSLERWIQ